ncbi:MAG: hypothetical protein AAFU71_07825, partial [Cyanobacteria bacterium J06632_22]
MGRSAGTVVTPRRGEPANEFSGCGWAGNGLAGSMTNYPLTEALFNKCFIKSFTWLYEWPNREKT